MALATSSWRAGLLALVAMCMAACHGRQEVRPQFGGVDRSRLVAADREPEQWLANGRDWRGAYFSPLKQIDLSSVSRLGFAWSYDLGTARGQEATPVVVDGVMY